MTDTPSRTLAALPGTLGTPGGRLLSGPPAYRPATPWKPAPALLATAAIVIAGVVATALTLLLGRPASQSDEISRALWALAATQAVAVVLTLLASGRYGGRLRDVLALRAAPGGWRAYAGAMVAMAVLQALLAGVQHFVLHHDLLTDVRPIVGLVTGGHWPLAAAALAVGAPLSEELLFRGFLLGALAQGLEKGLSVRTQLLFRGFHPGELAHRRLGFWSAALISTSAWTALHYGYSLMGLADVFANGLLFCWLLWRTGSLRVPLFCHAAYNGAIVLALLLVGLPAPA